MRGRAVWESVLANWLLVAWHILFLRLGPQDLPTSSMWTLLAALAYLMSGGALLHWREVHEGIVAMLAVDMLLLLAFIVILLRFVGRPERISQTLQAIFLAAALLHMLAIPFAPVLANPPEEPTVWLHLALIMTLAIVFWSIVLVAHVLRHALDWAFSQALILSVGYTLLNVVITYHVFPVD